MERNNVTQVFAGAYGGSATASATLTPISPITGSATPLAANEVHVTNSSYADIDTAVAIPSEFYVVGYDPVTNYRVSSLIKKRGFIRKTTSTYNVGTSYAQRWSGFAAPVIGDTLTYRITITDPRAASKPLDFVGTVTMLTTTLATELTRIAASINLTASTYLFEGIQVIQAAATATTIVITHAVLVPDLTNILYGSIFSFETKDIKSYDLSALAETNNWLQLHPSFVITAGSVTSALWTGVTYSAFTFSATAAAEAMGTIAQVRQMFYQHIGQQGAVRSNTIANRQPTYTWLSGTYSCIVLTYDDVTFGPSVGAPAQNEHTVVIYVTSGANFTALDAFLDAIIAGW